jgi:hypothetical protein
MLEERLAELEAETAAVREQVRELPLLREQIVVLVSRVQELECRLAKDSHNRTGFPNYECCHRGYMAGRSSVGQTVHVWGVPKPASELPPCPS